MEIMYVIVEVLKLVCLSLDDYLWVFEGVKNIFLVIIIGIFFGSYNSV